MPESRLATFATAGACGLMASAVVLAATVWGVGAASTAAPLPTMHASAACARHAVPAPVAPADGGMSITVRVPATVVLQVEWNGDLIGAMTNTGCAPHGDEDVYLMWPDRSITECMTFDVGAVQWNGTFTEPGVYEPQAGHDVCP